MQIQGEENRGCPYEYQNGRGSFFRMHYPLEEEDCTATAVPSTDADRAAADKRNNRTEKSL